MTSTEPRRDPYGGDVPGSGWLLFAGIILGLSGAMRIIDALWAFDYRGSIPEDLQGGLLGSELKTYGWVWLTVGVVLLVTSVAVLARVQVARWLGIIGGVLSALAATVWLPYFPVWSLIYVTLAVLVIYALARWGGHDPAP